MNFKEDQIVSVEKELQARSESKCELCSATDSLGVYEVPPTSNGSVDECVLLCEACRQQIEDPEKMDVHHWHCLNDSMWTQIPAVQVMAWRMLKRISSEGWAQDLLDMLYLEDETRAWAEAMGDDAADDATAKRVDCNGAPIAAGDTVTLVKDLVVKGGGFTAKRGTAVRNISLVPDNPEQIEGRVNGMEIVILTKYTKKAK